MFAHSPSQRNPFVSCAEANSLVRQGDFGCIVTNPPYGIRIENSQPANEALGDLARELGTWSTFALSGDDGFEKAYGERATKNRKLFNGKLPCRLYQYFGPLPPREPREPREGRVVEGDGTDGRDKSEGGRGRGGAEEGGIDTSVLMVIHGTMAEGEGEEGGGSAGRTLKPVQRKTKKTAGKRSGAGSGAEVGERGAKGGAGQGEGEWNPEAAVHKSIKEWVSGHGEGSEASLIAHAFAIFVTGANIRMCAALQPLSWCLFAGFVP